ncbi:SPOR domain-containing protein [candidate division WOR-3 bacterium]|nr:SPOR domain-containing protein [candidate division WOR-3 bacterium]
MRYVTIIFLFILSSCAVREAPPIIEVIPEEEAVIITEEESPDTVDIVIEVTATVPEKREEETVDLPSYRFSVQIAALSTKEDAQAFKIKAEGRMNEQVFIEFEAPYYKVRAGRSTDRKSAEITRNRIRAIYPDAFIVSKE